MAVATTQSEIRLERNMDERDLLTRKVESLMASVNERPDGQGMTETDKEQLNEYRERLVEIDTENETLSRDIEATRLAVENSKKMRRALAGAEEGVEISDDGIVYRDFYTYARDFVLTRDNIAGAAKLAKQYSSEAEQVAMRERLEMLKRTPANTLSSNIAGISVAQHIDQIFQVINTDRPIVASATRMPLERGSITYPSVDTKPVVAVQNTQKTEAGNTGMAISLKTATASTYLGGGDLSWQAINWSTPDALQLWFNYAAASYALLTEQDAAAVITHSGYAITSPWNAASGTFADLLTAVGKAASGVWTNSGRTADTVYMSMDAYWYTFGLTSTAFAQFATVSGDRVGPFRFVASRGLDAATIIVGDSSALLVAETPGAPVELRVVEPAIGGVEVGIIGAFEAVVVDPGAFIRVSSAS